MQDSGSLHIDPIVIIILMISTGAYLNNYIASDSCVL